MGRAADESSYVDFLYVDANEGSASGGHVALRIGDRTYHFGYHEPGHLRLDRDASARFEHVYGTLENRNLKVLRIDVTPETRDRVRGAFNERYLIERSEFGRLDDFHRDLAFAQTWFSDVPRVEIRGAGYLRVRPGRPASAALRRLQEAIVKRYGPGFLARQHETAKVEVARLPEMVRQPVPALAPAGAISEGTRGLAAHAENAKSRVEAFGWLMRGDAALRRTATAHLRSEAFPLDGPTREALSSFARHLEADLVDAVASPRPDVGYALLVGIARLLVLEETLETGHLVVLDVFPEDAARLSIASIESQGGDLEVMAGELAVELEKVRLALLRKRELRESDYAELEGLACRSRELERAGTEGTDVRAAVGRLLPLRPATFRLDLAPSEALGSYATSVRDRTQELEARLDASHRYNLIAHNCVSELFVQLSRAVGGEPTGDVRASIESLGGFIEPESGLDFIPFLAADEVEASYRVARIDHVSSHRRRLVEVLEAREGLPATLRESNVLTSTVYERNDADSAFLFFTDDKLGLRPVLGAANLFYGLAAVAAGIPLAPFDEGASLSAGLRGVLWSVPELVFINVRKGSYFHVPRAPAS